MDFISPKSKYTLGSSLYAFTYQIYSFRVELEFPTIEVRYQHLNIVADAYIGTRGLPTFFNSYLNAVEVHNMLDVFCEQVLSSFTFYSSTSNLMCVVTLISLIKAFANYLHLLPSKKKPLSILHDVCGIIKPHR